MRKHFLILMLLALLPLAGWAATAYTSPEGVTFKVGDATITTTDAYLEYSATQKDLPVPATIKVGEEDRDLVLGESLVEYKWYKTTVTNGTVVKTGEALAKLEDAGTYICEFKINLGNQQSNRTTTLTIKKFDLNVTAPSNNADGYFHVTYGSALPTDLKATYGAWPDALKVTDEDDEDTKAEKETKIKNLINAFGTLSFTSNYVAKTTGAGATGIKLTPRITDLNSGNYEFVAVSKDIVVDKKSLEAEDANFTVIIEELTYNGGKQTPVPTVKDVDLDKELVYDAETTTNNEFTLSYYDENPDNDGAAAVIEANYATKLKDARDYWVKITGAKNYEGSIVKPYKVNQKSLWITSKSNNIDYSGQVIADYKTDLAGFATFEGLVTGDKNANGTPITTAYKKTNETYASINIYMKKGDKTYDNSNAANTPKDAGEYEVKFKASTTDNSAIFTNYRVVFVESGKFTINKCKVVVKVRQDLGKLFGEVSALESGVTPTAENANEYIESITGFPDSYTDATYTYTEVFYNPYPTLKLGAKNADGTYPVIVDFSKAKVGLKKANTSAPDSYTITALANGTANYEFDYVAGKFTIGKGRMAVRPINVEDAVYGGEKKTLTVSAYGGTTADNTAVEKFLKDALEISEKGLPFNADGSVNEQANDDDKVDYPAAGQYIISFNLKKLDAKKLAEWNDKYYFEYFNESKYIIKKAPLTIKLGEQSLNVGEKAEALVKDDKTITIKGLQYDDKADALYANVKFKFAGVAATGTPATQEQEANPYAYVGTDGKLTEDAATYKADENAAKGFFAGAITLSEATVFANYSWTATAVTNGDLYVSNAIVAGLALDEQEVTDETADDAEDYTYSAKDRLIKANNQKQNVTVKIYRSQKIANTTYSWKAQQFNALVLPFDVTVAELSAQFGYAIVNVVNPEKTTDGNIYWSLAWDRIDANTPFVVRTVADINGDYENGGKVLSFQKKTIKYVEAPSVPAGQGYQVVGAYAPYTIDNTSAAKQRFFGDNKDHGIKADSELTWTIYPFDAYLDYTGNTSGREVTLTFEDLNGGTTSISSVELARDAMPAAEGWYTLNGIKLQGVPTEKGVYIQNGKKVVIK